MPPGYGHGLSGFPIECGLFVLFWSLLSCRRGGPAVLGEHNPIRQNQRQSHPGPGYPRQPQGLSFAGFQSLPVTFVTEEELSHLALASTAQLVFDLTWFPMPHRSRHKAAGDEHRRCSPWRAPGSCRDGPSACVAPVLRLNWGQVVRLLVPGGDRKDTHERKEGVGV